MVCWTTWCTQRAASCGQHSHLVGWLQRREAGTEPTIGDPRCAEVHIAPKSHFIEQFWLFLQLLVITDLENTNVLQEQCKRRYRESSRWGAKMSNE